MNLRIAAVAVVVLAGSVACTAPPEWQGTIEERDGVAYVDSPAHLDLFDTQGRYLTSRIESMAEMGTPDEVDADGKIYTNVMDPYPHVRRYRVVIDQR